MFTALSEQLTAVLQRLRGRGVLSEADVTDTLREIRRHLLEADVSFEVTRAFVERVRGRAVGALQIKAVSPGQQVAKLVHDEIAAMLGGTKRGLDFASVGPTVILLVGLQGSGKTTTAAKLARRLKLEQKAPCLVAADVYRPAAGEQLRQLGGQVGVPVFPGKGEEGRGGGVVELVWQAVREAEQARCRAVIVDTAGRVQIDVAMMDELRALQQAVEPREVLLVADGMSGQDAVRIAQGFHADDKRLKHVEAIVLSMTPEERAEPTILTGSRRLRIAKGAGRPVQEVNRLLAQFQQMKQLLKGT